MTETAPKKKLPAAQRIAKLQALRDQERLNLIYYDDTLAKEENYSLKSELKHLQALRREEQMSKSLAKSKSWRPQALSQSMSQYRNQDGPAAELKRSGSPQNNPAFFDSRNSQPENFPIVKRKGTGYHKRFVREVKPRDYGLYLNSLNAMKEYRSAEYENKHIKEKLFREKYKICMNQFKQNSKHSWQRVMELQHVQPKPCNDPAHAKDEKTKKEPVKTEEKKPEEKKPEPAKKPEEKKPEEKKPEEKKPEPAKKPEEKKPEEKKPDPAKKADPPKKLDQDF